MIPLQMRLEEYDDFTIMYMAGSSNAVNKQSEEVINLRNTFKDIPKKGKNKVIIDLKAVEYLSSNTIGAFLSGNAIMKKEGGKIILCNPSDYIMNIFNIVKLEQVFTICKTLDEAKIAIKE